MAHRKVPKRVFARAKEDAAVAKTATETPQTTHPAYKLAFQDSEFLLREDLRPVRFQLELLKPELLLDEANIGSTFVMYGSARIPAPEKADALVEAAVTDKQRKIAERLRAKSRYYDEARKLAQLASECPPDDDGKRQFVVCSGGGPSIMEAANRGAWECGAKSIGLNITLPHEQDPNPYITPELCFQFHYFSLRKMHFLMRAKALVAFPGGYGTLDELFETLTLVQTGKKRPLPIVLVGKQFWKRLIDYDYMAEQGMINWEDVKLFKLVDTAEEGWDHIRRFWKAHREGAATA